MIQMRLLKGLFESPPLSGYTGNVKSHMENNFFFELNPRISFKYNFV